MPDAPDYASITRRHARPWLAIVLIAIAIAVACVVWRPNLTVYLVALGVAALAAVRAAFILTDGRQRVLGHAVIVLVLAASIVTPWRLAEAERSGSPRWTTATDGIADHPYVDGNRMLFTDYDGLHALDLRTGKILWTFDGISRIAELKVAADGHVLVRSGRTEGDQAAWLSPDGRELWRSEMQKRHVYLMGLDLENVLASSHGVLAAPRCTTKAEVTSCTYVGIGPDGKQRWESKGFESRALFERQEADSSDGDPRRLPEAAVIDTEPGFGGTAQVVAADDGDVTATIDYSASVPVITRKIVVSQTASAGSSKMCRSHGVSIDGKVDWTAETPCLSISAVVLGTRVYGDVDDDRPESDDRIIQSYMIDAETGHWKIVGGLEQFNSDKDARVGVPGADVVVQRNHQQLTGRDPDTGKKLWELHSPGDGIPGVSTAHGAAVVLSDAGRGHNPFFAGDERLNGRTILVVDSKTGHVTGSRSMPDVWNIVPAGPGRAVLIDRDELSLIGSAAD
ncbi:hypothetical protein ASE12_12660 [Aeromicrobium sp. Root236]|uniref:outer membrane protein assembly factor BamB family protein n=1 Tax=Aeromicrobium sp. Root236 TaxID=1736498 RepID=UPI0006FA768A|nr:PQQ-binding-like beta-propeller repeat protein [Aeromicrobium sp. Root236]KRC65529.1 hypothetical protein ASE12_12660 [Aeromicrobium sp. Root236]